MTLPIAQTTGIMMKVVPYLQQHGLSLNLPDNHSLNSDGWKQLAERVEAGTLGQGDIDWILQKDKYISMNQHNDAFFKKVGNEAGSVVKDAIPVAAGVLGFMTGGPLAAAAMYNFGNEATNVAEKLLQGETLHWEDFRDLGVSGAGAYLGAGGLSGIKDMGFALQNLPAVASEYGSSIAAFGQKLFTDPIGAIKDIGGNVADFVKDPIGALTNWAPKLGTNPQNLMNAMNAMSGGQGLGGLMGLLNSGLNAYRGYEAADAMRDAVNRARNTQQQYYGDAQNYLGQGIATGRQDLVIGADQAADRVQRYGDMARSDLLSAEDRAADRLVRYSDQARNDLTSALDQSRADVAPWYQGGQSALQGQMGLLGLAQGMPGGLTPQQYLEQTPGYQWQMNQGLNAVQNQMAKRGLSASGAEQQALNNYAQGLASTTFDQRLNQLAQLSGLGANLGSQMASNQINVGSNLSNLAYNTGSQLANYGMTTGAGLANVAQNTGNTLGGYAYGTGQGLADLAFRGGAMQGQTAMDQANRLGYYDLAGGAVSAGAIAGTNTGNPLMDIGLMSLYG